VYIAKKLKPITTKKNCFDTAGKDVIIPIAKTSDAELV
jgi:hypothetical protein